MTQLGFVYDKQPWQMTLAEFTQGMVGTMRPDFAHTGHRRADVAIDLRGEIDRAYIRKEYKWSVIRAEQAGEDVPSFVYREHPILAQLHADRQVSN